MDDRRSGAGRGDIVGGHVRHRRGLDYRGLLLTVFVVYLFTTIVP
jgi:hypothetical protein